MQKGTGGGGVEENLLALCAFGGTWSLLKAQPLPRQFPIRTRATFLFSTAARDQLDGSRVWFHLHFLSLMVIHSLDCFYAFLFRPLNLRPVRATTLRSDVSQHGERRRSPLALPAPPCHPAAAVLPAAAAALSSCAEAELANRFLRSGATNPEPGLRAALQFSCGRLKLSPAWCTRALPPGESGGQLRSRGRQDALAKPSASLVVLLPRYH